MTPHVRPDSWLSAPPSALLVTSLTEMINSVRDKYYICYIPSCMLNFLEVLLLSSVMGLSIYLSLPLLINRKLKGNTMRLLLGAAIGILIFLCLDIFSDVSPILYSTGTLAGYGSNPAYDAVFTASIVVGFMVLYFFEGRSKSGLSMTQLSLLIAVGIGFQNLTEGLVFGSLGVTLGLTGVTLVVLVGFTFQNLTEGFPIASPFLGKDAWRLPTMLGLFLIGGLPTILGGAIGYYYTSNYAALLFNGVAIGAILYVILPMLKILLKDMDLTAQRIAYMGIFVGFIAGFIVNLF